MKAFHVLKKVSRGFAEVCWCQTLTGTEVTVVLVVLLYVYDEMKGLTASAKLLHLLVSAFDKPMICKLKKFSNCPLGIMSH